MVNLEKIIDKLGQPLKRSGQNLIWECPYCLDKSQNNLIYNIDKGVLWCFASGGEHSGMILSEISKNSSDKIYTKPYAIEPKKKTLAPDKIKYFTDIMHKYNDELLNNSKMLDFLECKRGINSNTVKNCFIGVDMANKRFVFPTIEFMTNNIIGFEYRPLDLSKNIRREIGGLTGLAQVNSFTNKTQALAILGGYLDCYAFYQHLKEIGQIDFYHIATSSNGEGATLKYLEDTKEHFNKYCRIYLYLDSDNTGITQMEKIKAKFPFVEIKTMSCGCKDFNEHYLKCIKSQRSVPELPQNKDLSICDINSYNDELKLDIRHSGGLLKYEINLETYKLIANNKMFDIPKFFNLKSAIQGDFKTLDYIFAYCGLDINQFKIGGL